MKINKDEAMVLWKALYEQKYDINNNIEHYAKANSIRSIDAFENLESRLYEFGTDKRRNGRKSMNDFTDILKRFVKKFTKK